MNVISFKKLKQFWETHPKSEPNLRFWYKNAASSKCQNFVELREVFPSADLVGNFTVFNVGGNNYRLIALVDYEYQKVFVRHILTHSEYDKENWKNDEWFT